MPYITEQKKVVERYQLKKFLQYAPLSLNQVNIVDSESPDFILALPKGKAVGVELTEVFWPSEDEDLPAQGVHALYDKIVDMARREYDKQDGPPVAVSVIFSPAFTPSKRDAPSTSKSIANFVLAHVPDEEGERIFSRTAFLRNLECFPENVRHIHIYRWLDLKRSYFMSPKSSFIPSLKREHVEKVIQRKEKKLKTYRENYPECEEMWLVMVCNRELASQFDLDRLLFTTPLPSNFDRVFLFLEMDEQVHELSLR